MSLADDIQALRDRVLTDLGAAHDYYANTKVAWQIVRRAVKGGRKFTVRNVTTGTVSTQAELAAQARGYVSEQLAEATFQQFISLFESFFLDFLRLWLVAYPQSLGAKKVDFKAVLDAPDKDSVVLLVVDKELNEVLYDRPAGWFAYLEDKAKLGCPTAGEVARFAEAKASRDVLVHNRGIANKLYESKAGRFARFAEGQRLLIPEHYHRETWELACKVVADVSNAAAAKVP